MPIFKSPEEMLADKLEGLFEKHLPNFKPDEGLGKVFTDALGSVTTADTIIRDAKLVSTMLLGSSVKLESAIEKETVQDGGEIDPGKMEGILKGVQEEVDRTLTFLQTKEDFAVDRDVVFQGNMRNFMGATSDFQDTNLALLKTISDDLFDIKSFVIGSLPYLLAGLGSSRSGSGLANAVGDAVGGKTAKKVGGKALGLAKNIKILGGGLAALSIGLDAIEGARSEYLADNSNVSAAISSALTGGENSSTLAQGLKGAGIGFAVAGPLGAAVGGLIGAGLSKVDTKWLADQIDTLPRMLEDIGGKLKSRAMDVFENIDSPAQMLLPWKQAEAAITFAIGKERVDKVKAYGAEIRDEIKNQTKESFIKLSKETKVRFKTIQDNYESFLDVINPVKTIKTASLAILGNDRTDGIIKDIEEIQNEVLYVLTKPFTKEFWTGEEGLITKFLGTDFMISISEKIGGVDIIGTISEKIMEIQKGIMDFIMKPLSKEFWFGENGILSKVTGSKEKTELNVESTKNSLIHTMSDFFFKNNDKIKPEVNVASEAPINSQIFETRINTDMEKENQEMKEDQRSVAGLGSLVQQQSVTNSNKNNVTVNVLQGRDRSENRIMADSWGT